MRAALILVATLSALALPDLFEWHEGHMEALVPLGGEERLRLLHMRQPMGYGYFQHLLMVVTMETSLPDTFCVNGDALVSPSDYGDTLEVSGYFQILSLGEYVELDRTASAPPDTLVLRQIAYPFRAPPDTSFTRWIYDSAQVPGTYITH